jgi:hypothetical protein
MLQLNLKSRQASFNPGKGGMLQLNLERDAHFS